MIDPTSTAGIANDFALTFSPLAFTSVRSKIAFLSNSTMSPFALIVRAAISGDNEAGDALIRRHFDAVCRFFRTKLGDEVEDLIQRTFQVCTAKRGELTREGSFRGFLFGVARNLLLDHLRRRYRRGEHENGDDLLNELRRAPGLTSADLKISKASPETPWRRDEIYGDDGR